MNEKAVHNAAWMIGIRILQAVLNLLITMLTARFLGPSNFGLINYAASIVAFAAPIMQLGMNSILVQELVTRPEKEGEILGSAMFSCLCSATLSIAGVLAFAVTANGDSMETVLICALYSLSLLSQALEMIIYWFYARLLSKYSSIVSLVAYLIVSAYKAYLLIFGKSIRWFAVANAIDFLIIAVILMILYRRIGGKRLCISRKTCVQLFEKGKYYILSGLMIAVFAQTDRIMLKNMIGDAETGFYSAAVTCAGMTGFVFSAIIESASPGIFASKKIGQKQFENQMRNLYTIVIYGALLQSVCITILSKPIVLILYGTDYLPTVEALRIIVWYTTFCYLGAVRNRWMLAENKQNLIWRIDVSGASANVILNMLLIPRYGMIGAATASLITQIFTNVIMGEIIRDVRENNRLMYQSLSPRNIYNIVRNIMRMIKKPDIV